MMDKMKNKKYHIQNIPHTKHTTYKTYHTVGHNSKIKSQNRGMGKLGDDF